MNDEHSSHPTVHVDRSRRIWLTGLWKIGGEEDDATCVFRKEWMMTDGLIDCNVIYSI